MQHTVKSVDIPVEFSKEAGRLTLDGHEIPQELEGLFSGLNDGDEVVINVTFHGYFTPGVWYTPNGDGYPDEYDQECETNFIEIGEKPLKVDNPLFFELDNFLYDIVVDTYEVEW